MATVYKDMPPKYHSTFRFRAFVFAVNEPKYHYQHNNINRSIYNGSAQIFYLLFYGILIILGYTSLPD